MSTIACLLYASPDRCADLRYLGRVSVPDPFIAFVINSRSTAVLNELEFGRVRRESAFDEVLLQSDVVSAAAKRFRRPKKQLRPVDLITHLLRERNVSRLKVGEDFSAGIAFKLKRRGFQIECVEASLFPERIAKSDWELAAIREGNQASAAGIRAAEAALRTAKIRSGVLYLKGEVLTSERLRTIIEMVCLEYNAVSDSVIVAGGDQACDPHEVGYGPLRANELIIIDVFPRVRSTGYHGDMTRTFLKGKATPAQHALISAVRAAHAAAIKAVRANVKGEVVHAAVESIFNERGFPTRRTDQGFEGFIHSTGHGLGLEVHEGPRVSKGSGPLPAGAVVTIEPGLYYPGLGAVRIEDVVHVTPGGSEKLSSLHYKWELP